MPNTKVVTGIVRLSYVHVWEATSIHGGPEKYRVCMIIPKSDLKTVHAINDATIAAILEGAKKYPPIISYLKLPLHDGDVEKSDPIYKNSFFLNASSSIPPQIVDRKVNPIHCPSELYSGCYARVSVTFYPYAHNGQCGVACNLGNIQKVSDGERLDRRFYAKDDFTAE